MKLQKKTCFFITPFRIDSSLVHGWSDSIVKNILTPAIAELGYLKPVRADKISNTELITTQIVNFLVQSDLVIADLTEQNPNVFYELAIRHTTQKPVVHIIREGDSLPFGFKKANVVSISSNLKKSKTDIKHLKDQIRAAEKKPIAYTFIKDYAILKNAFAKDLLSESDKQSLFDIFTNMHSSIQVMEGQISKLDNKISAMQGDVRVIQAATLPSPFVERRLAKFESIKYKVQQKGLADKTAKAS